MTAVPESVSNNFKIALRQYFSDESIQIVRFNCSRAIPIGENFTTDVVRTSITYTTEKSDEEKKLSVIVKCSPPNEIINNYVESMGLFANEIDVYTKVLPAMYSLLGKKLGKMSPRFISFVDKPLPAMVLQDVLDIGFKVHPRQNGINLPHCLLIVEKLAYFHAASAVLHEKEPSLIIHHKKGIFGDNPFTLQWITNGFQSLIEACSTWPSCQKYTEKLERLKETVVEKSIASAEKNSEDFNVLNHGDFWTNNFMFSYDSNGEPQDSRFIDFQVVFHASPACDLNYFWTTTPSMEVRIQHLETVLNHYYTKLVTTLRQLQFSSENIPNREKFRKEFDNRTFYGLATAATVLPLVSASTREDATFENFVESEGEDSFRYDAYNNERYRKIIEHLLPYYDNLHILD